MEDKMATVVYFLFSTSEVRLARVEERRGEQHRTSADSLDTEITHEASSSLLLMLQWRRFGLSFGRD